MKLRSPSRLLVRFLPLALVAIVPLAAPAHGQFINAYGISKNSGFVQSSHAAPVAGALFGQPYHFEVNVSGSNLGLLASAPQLTLPDATTYSLTLHGTSSYSFVGETVPHSFATKAALDAAFPNGTYAMNLAGTDISLALGALDAYPTEIPMITNGTWSNGRLQVDPALGLTLDFSSFPSYGSGSMVFILTSLDNGNPANQVVYQLANSLTGPAMTGYTIAPSFLTAGEEYYGRLLYSHLVTTDLTSIPGAAGYALFMNETSFLVSTIPEPATVGLLLGSAVLVAVIGRRLRAAKRRPQTP